MLNKTDRHTMVHGPRIFANSMPKSGTHLLRRILSMMPGVLDRWTYHYDQNIAPYSKQLSCAKGGQIISAHQYWDEAFANFLSEHRFRTFLVVRDLRDVSVSGAHYCAKDTRHRLYKYFNAISSWDQQLAAIIEGIPSELLAGGVRSNSMAQHIEQYMPWLNDSDCLLVRFEDLVGTRGGGNEQSQHQIISAIGSHIGADLNDEDVAEIADRSFSSKTKTFRKGQLGGWRDEFSEDNIMLFKKVAGLQLIQLGYEQDKNW